MANEIGQVGVDVKPEVDDKAIDQLDGDLTSRFKALGDKLGGGLKAGLSAGAVGVGGLVAAGAGLYKLGGDFDAVYDGIQTKTGKTGKELDALKDSFRNVAKTVPTDFETAGTAIGDLAAKTGLAGKPLDDLAAKYLNLAHLVDGDVSKSIAENQKLFADFGLSAADSSKGLDKLFSVSQKTGTDMGTLSATMDKFGPQLRQMGLSFDESAELVGKLSQRGVDASKVLGGMGLVSAANAKDIQKANDEVGKAEKKLEEETRKANEAVEKAKAKAGMASIDAGAKGEKAAAAEAEVRAKMADKIAEAEAKLEAANGLHTKNAEADAAKRAAAQLNLEKVKRESQTAIEAASARTAAAEEADGEKSKKTSAAVAEAQRIAAQNIAAAQAAVKSAREDAMALEAKAADGTKLTRERMEELVESMKNAASPTLALAEAQGVLGKKVGMEFVDAVRTGKLSMDDFAASMGDGAGAINDTAADTADAAETMQLAMNRAKLAIEPLAEKAFGLAATLAEKVAPAIETVAEWLGEKLPPIIAAVERWISGTLVPALRNMADWFEVHVVPAIRTAVDYVVNNWPKVQQVIGQVLTAVKEIITTTIGAIAQIWESSHDRVRVAAEITWDAIRERIRSVMEIIRGIIQTVTSLIHGDWSGAWNGIKAIADGIWDGIVSSVRTALRLHKEVIDLALDAVVKVFQSLGGWILDALKAFPTLLADTGKRLIDGLANAIALAWETLIGWVKSMPLLIANGVGDLWEVLRATGRRLVDGMLDAAKAAFAAVIEFAGSIRGAIAEKVGDLWDGIRGTGRRLVDGFIDSVRDTWNGVVGWFGTIRQMIADKVGDLIDGLSGTGKRLITGMIDAAKDAWNGTAEWFGGLGKAAADKVGDLIGTLKTTGGNLITGLWDAAKAKWTEVTGWFGGLGAAAATALGGIGSVIGDALAAAMKIPINAIIGIINNLKIPSFSFSLNVPDWVPGMPDKLHWDSGEIDPIPYIKPLAKGGIIDRATLAVFGEAGVEAAAPLGADRVADFRNVVTDARFLGQMARAFPGGGGSRSVVLNNYAPPVRELDEAELVRMIRRAEMLAGV